MTRTGFEIDVLVDTDPATRAEEPAADGEARLYIPGLRG